MAAPDTVPETVTVTTTTVACDGTQDSGGHPRVFLKIDPKAGEVTCPYCSRVFKLDPGAKPASGH